MHPIKIDNKKYKIKGINELTTKEFIELSQIEGLDYVRYIAWQLGIKDEKAFKAVVSKTVENAIGVIPDIKKMPFCDKFDKSKIIETIGQRHQIEDSGKKDYELLVWTLAVSQLCTLDQTQLEKEYDKYMDMLFYEILPSGYFFFQSFVSGRRKGIACLKNYLLKIRHLWTKKRQGLTS